jgi:molecular chaperone DnaJ
MSSKRDYYEVLGIERTASDGDVSVAYRKLAIRYHPDKNPGDDEAITRFKEAAEAFEVLSDAEKRARYDRFGHAGVDAPGRGGAPHFNDVNDIFQAFGNIFGEGVFGDLFGGGRSGQRGRKGSDLRIDVTLNLVEAARGVSKTVRFQRQERCGTCNGSGAKPGSTPETCRYCGGQGQVIQSAGIFRMQTTCPSCQGQGQTIKQHCPDCRGQGLVVRQVELNVTIPAGVDTGNRMRLGGQGNPGPNGGPPGDAYVIFTITEHSLFQRDGQHLILRMPITYSQAALGATVEVPTLDGREDLNIPAGTQPNDVFKLRGKGLPNPNARGVGDLLVQVNIEVPKSLTKRQEEILRELAGEEHTNVSAHRKSFFEKLRDYFVPTEDAEQETHEEKKA